MRQLTKAEHVLKSHSWTWIRAMSARAGKLLSASVIHQAKAGLEKAEDKKTSRDRISPRTEQALCAVADLYCAELQGAPVVHKERRVTVTVGGQTIVDEAF